VTISWVTRRISSSNVDMADADFLRKRCSIFFWNTKSRVRNCTWN
jgi:hypothetical protein